MHDSQKRPREKVNCISPSDCFFVVSCDDDAVLVHSMKILVIGDIFGKLGRKIVETELPQLKKQYEPDFIIANSENICHGKGPQMKHIRFLEDLGCDVLT